VGFGGCGRGGAASWWPGRLPRPDPAVPLPARRFAGEALCLVAHAALASHRRRAAGRAPPPPPRPRLRSRVALAFAAPACLDAVATTLVNVGLFYTSASVYQMLRGTLVIFAAGFTVVLLRRRLHTHHAFGVVLIAAGAALVGAANVVYDDGGGRVGVGVRAARVWLPMSGPPPHPPPPPHAARNALIGNLLVVGAQAATALQFILEEKVLAAHRTPALLAVGLEGAWGLLLCAGALPLLSTVTLHGKPLDDASAALRAITASPRLAASTAACVLSIAAFNFCGVSVTQRLDGASRAAADICRTLLVWAVSVGAGWERFRALQLLGFAVLLAGSALYNELIRGCLPTPDESDESGESGDDAEAPLLPGPRPPSAAARPAPARVDPYYTMARSMRLFPPRALSPHSLASPAVAGLGTGGGRGGALWAALYPDSATTTPDPSTRGASDAGAALGGDGEG